MILRNSCRLMGLLAIFIFAQAIFAQARIGTVQGTIKDPGSALVAGARVTITQPLTGYSQTVQTDSQGSFKLVNVPFNTYKVQVEAPGFAKSEQSIDLESTIPLSLDFSLSLAGATESVTVTTD